MNSFCVLSDSGTLSEESALLGFVGVLLRTSTERPEVLDKGTVVLGGITGEEVNQAVELAVAMARNGETGILAPRLPGYQRFDKGGQADSELCKDRKPGGMGKLA